MLPPIQKVGDLVKPEITDAIRKCARKLSFTEEGKLKGCLFTLAVCYSPEEAEAVEKFKESEGAALRKVCWLQRRPVGRCDLE